MTTSGIMHRTVEANGIHLHIAEQGDGPVVVLCHGFPESWYSWRHQLAALSAAGFRAVAPDMRGYGQSDRPDAMDQYTLLHLVGDIVGLVDALGVDRAAIAGHDWGATVAWHSALLRPDRFRAVIGLSVPFQPRTSVVPTSVMPRRDDAMFFQLYFQTPGVAEAELQRDVRATIAKLLYSASGDAPRPGDGGGDLGMVSHGGGFLGRMLSPSVLLLTARIIPFAFAWTYEDAELHPLVLAIRRPFRVECNAIPDPLSRPPCSNSARRNARSPCTCHSLARPSFWRKNWRR